MDTLLVTKTAVKIFPLQIGEALELAFHLANGKNEGGQVRAWPLSVFNHRLTIYICVVNFGYEIIKQHQVEEN